MYKLERDVSFTSFFACAINSFKGNKALQSELVKKSDPSAEGSNSVVPKVDFFLRWSTAKVQVLRLLVFDFSQSWLSVLGNVFDSECFRLSEFQYSGFQVHGFK